MLQVIGLCYLFHKYNCIFDLGCVCKGVGVYEYRLADVHKVQLGGVGISQNKTTENAAKVILSFRLR